MQLWIDGSTKVKAYIRSLQCPVSVSVNGESIPIVYDLFQAGWSGAPYREECRKAAAQMINLDGTPCSVKNTFVKESFEHEKEITQLQAITKYIAHFAKEHNYRAGRRLWMDPLPKYLYLEDIIEENKD